MLSKTRVLDALRHETHDGDLGTLLAFVEGSELGQWTTIHDNDSNKTIASFAICSHTGAMNAMAAGILTKKLAMQFLTDIRARLQSATRRAIENEKGYVIDVNLGSGGQAKSSLYYVFKDAGVYCGKAYADDPVSMEHERSVSLAVHSMQAVPTLIKVIDAFHSGSHSVLILPLLAKSAADLQMARPNGISCEAAAYVCVAVLAAVAGLANEGWCHADIKPANIMLAGNEKGAVLVDLGSCTRVGEEIKECTELYALGLPRVAGLQWDLTCLASTLCVLSGFSQLLGSTVVQVQASLVGLQGQLPLGCQLAMCILGHSENVNSVADLQARVWEDVMGLVQGSLGEETAKRLVAAWPSPL
ncbi:putative serine/threonine-protein kinase [Tetrabaena socialis]|uniref:Putative serine/threonine-protein kinase n=1 Tax=Tetrabaena socialis TaxID=47790 RepID=A0A2J7ZKE3_9CHLO|nr:putative serine/threonine-protein kinase [Tetrabaena socialis]|eukprot:PNH00720.1 putative serine/threonine-protein kinase [Tetrabaena socialis]